LVKAIQTESNIALCRLLNVTAQTITKWRHALGVPVATPGTVRLGQLYLPERISPETFKKAIRAAHTHAANHKRAATHTGVPRPNHVRAILSRTGKKDSEATRKKKSRAAKRRGAWPPAAGRPWTAKEDQAVQELSPKLAVKATGRSLGAVWWRRRLLKKS
jgi:hypothetical protein